MSQIEDMRIVVEVVDRGSFSAAATRLGVTKQLVSRRVMALEERLGVQLLVRTTRRLAPSELGQDYVERARRIIAEVEDAEQAMASHVAAPRGTLRISAPLSFGQSHLSPLLAGFLSLHPGVRLELDMADRPVNLVAEGYDVAVRIGNLVDSSLIARKLTTIKMVICATPSYLERVGIPTTIKELQSHDCLEYRHSKGATWPLTVNGALEMVAVRGCFLANNGDVLRDAAIAGLGLVQLPTFIIVQDLASRRLVTVMDAFAPPPTAAYVVHPTHRQRSRLVRAFSDYLAAGLSENLV
jgi:DNA-binding transcriptional LysR family regulator